MGRFVDKNELVITVILVILLDLNVASGEFIKYIFFGEASVLTYLLVLAGFLIDISILNIVVGSNDFEPINYQSVGSEAKAKTSTLTDPLSDPSVLPKVKKGINTLVAVILMIIVLSAFIIPTYYPDISSPLSSVNRLTRSLPLIASAASLTYFNVLQ